MKFPEQLININNISISDKNAGKHFIDKWTGVCEGGDLATVQACLRTDVNINSRDTYGRTPLLTASRSNQLEIMKILLPKDDLDLAAYNDYDIDGVLFVHGGGGTVLHYA